MIFITNIVLNITEENICNFCDKILIIICLILSESANISLIIYFQCLRLGKSFVKVLLETNVNISS